MCSNIHDNSATSVPNERALSLKSQQAAVTLPSFSTQGQQSSASYLCMLLILTVNFRALAYSALVVELRLTPMQVLTKAWSAALLNAIGDILAQKVVDKNDKLDMKRLGIFTFLVNEPNACVVVPLRKHNLELQSCTPALRTSTWGCEGTVGLIYFQVATHLHLEAQIKRLAAMITRTPNGLESGGLLIDI